MATRISVLKALVIVTCLSAAALAQPAAAPSGHWEGTIQVPGQELKIEVDLAKTGDTWEGRVSIPAQGMKGFPLSSISVQGDAVSFAMKGIPGDPTFTGTLAKDGKALSGTFTQGGGTIPFALTRTGEAKIEPLPKSTAITKEVEGSWEGSLDIDGTVLRLLARLSNGPDGTGTGTLVSLDQGGAEIPIGAVIQDGEKIKLLVPAIVGTYEGALKDGQLSGTWTQGPRSWPLVLKRTK
jgi:hypothetical protein